MEDSKMKKHVTAVAAIQIGFSTLWLIGAVVLYFILTFARGQVPVDEEMGIKVLTLLATVLPVFIGVIALIGLIGGIGLLSYKQWGRIMTIIVSALGCFNIPIGTLIGAYSIWVLMQDETVKMFQTE
jgi:hypothetical protein